MSLARGVTRRASASRETEKGFMQAIIEVARVEDWLVYHPFDSRKSTPGWPDLTLVRRPRLVFAELKVGTRQPTQAQWAWMLALKACPGHEVYVWRPEDWQEILEILKRRRP